MPAFQFYFVTLFIRDLDADNQFCQTYQWVLLPLQLCCPTDRCSTCACCTGPGAILQNSEQSHYVSLAPSLALREQAAGT